MCQNCNDRINRPVHRSDIFVLFSELMYNLFQTFTGFWESVYELSIYHAKREATINKVWEDFNSDLETIQEDTDGAN